MDHVGPQPSRVASEDELGAHATAGWHQSVEVSSVAEVSYGRSGHVRHSVLYIPSVRRGVRRMRMLPPGAERGSPQVVRALDRDLVYLSLGASALTFFLFQRGMTPYRSLIVRGYRDVDCTLWGLTAEQFR